MYYKKEGYQKSGGCGWKSAKFITASISSPNKIVKTTFETASYFYRITTITFYRYAGFIKLKCFEIDD